MSFQIGQVPQLRQTEHIATVCRALKNTNTPNRGYQKLGGNSGRRGYQGQEKSRHQNVRKTEAEHFVAPDGEASHDCSVGEEAIGLYVVNQHKGVSPKPIVVSINVEGKEIPMEVDTGADVSIIPFSTWRSHFPDIPLQSSAILLKTYTNEKLSVLGQHDVTVRYGDQVQKLIITVVDGDGPNLLGRDWLKQLRLNWTQISMVQNSSTQLEDFDDGIFRNFLG